MKRVKKIMDGNQAAAHVAYAYSEVASIYPITPSSTMAEVTDEWANAGRENIFGQTVQVTQMQSEAGAAGAMHGALVTGALTTTFTASQGLLLMIPNLYKMAGERLPGVLHVAARAIASHALSIFGDHSDIYACRQTGAAMLSSSSVQEVMDLTPVAHLAALKGRLPFINFFDGFRTSHEIQKIEAWDYKDLEKMLDMEQVLAFRQNALNPNHAKEMGSAQNPDIFFQAREASNLAYLAIPEIVEHYMGEINKSIGTHYGLFDYYGDSQASHVIIAMGSVCETIKEVIDYRNQNGEKLGLINVHLYRPFSVKHLLEKLPESVERITVLDRTKEPGAMGEPLYLDVVAALHDTKFRNVEIFSGRYGLGSKDTTPEQINAVYDNSTKKVFTIGIVDDVTHLSLPLGKKLPAQPDIIGAKFWGLGSDGTVGANKNSIKIIGEHTDKYVQAYFDYDSKKSGGLTVSHLRFGDSPIHSTYLVSEADFVACHNQSYIGKYKMIEDVKPGGIFLLNTSFDVEQIEEKLPADMKRYIAQNSIRFYLIDGVKIGKEIGLGNKINTILQAAFFTLSGVIPREEAVQYLKEAAKASYLKKGEKIVQMNYAAIEAGASGAVQVEVPESWLEAVETKESEPVRTDKPEVMEFVERIQKPVNSFRGNELPVSAFVEYQDGSTPSGTSAHERRKTAVDIPCWESENCIQCNRCSYVCPHGVIRPAVLTREELEQAPGKLQAVPMMGMPELYFAITVSNEDCTGCGSCQRVCPGKKGEKALNMTEVAALEDSEKKELQAQFDYGKELTPKEEVLEKFKETTVKGSQFKKPLLEFSGACAGCGETPYAKLITQLFGNYMYIANATGCSSIWGNSSPSTPYTTDKLGRGPAWSNSLFEDAAEFGYGMALAQNSIRARLKKAVSGLLSKEENEAVRDAAKEWLDTFSSGATNGLATEKLIAALTETSPDEGNGILKEKDFLAKKSQWIFGGDGWAYDIGFSGLDHVMASGQDINIMVFDTEMYSNTGGQASKSTPIGAIVKFAAGGKQTRKKDLASIAMSYGNVYVAQIAMGADYNQCIKAITEAEAFPGPSLIIAYAPCISHGIKTGMVSAQAEEEKAVKAGYWHLFRYNPENLLQGKPCFMLDSKKPTLEQEEFLYGELRYDALRKVNPEKAEGFLKSANEQAVKRYSYLEKLAMLYGEEGR